jgi:tetratricopeptide (TPR) repeat protein
MEAPVTVPLGRLRRLAIQSILLVVPLVFWAGSRDTFNAVKEAGLAVYAVPALAAWFAAGMPGSALVPRWYAGITGAFLLWIMARVPGTHDLPAAVSRAGEWVLVFASAISALGLPDRDRRRAADFFVAGAAVASLLGLAESAAGLRLFVPDPASVTFTPDRAAGTFGNPVCFAGYLLLAIPATVMLVAAAFRDGSRYRTTILSVILGLETAALILTSARSALVGLVVGAAILFNSMRGRAAILARIAAVAVVLAAGILAWRPALAVHLFTPADPGRTYIWNVTMRMWTGAPLAGVGTGQFAREYPCARQPVPRPSTVGFRGNAIYAHNEYLQALAEHGIPGAFGLIAVILGLFFLRVNPGARAGAGALATQALFAFPFQVVPTQTLMWLLPVLGLSGQSRSASGYGQALVAFDRNTVPRFVAAGIALTMLAAFAVRPLARGVYVNRALTAVGAGEHAKAVRQFDLALARSGDNARDRIGFQRGEALFRAGELGSAQAAFERDLEAFPCSPDAHGYLAFIHLMRAVHGQAGQLAKARDYVGRALAFGPDPKRAARFLNLQGNIRAQGGDAAGALASYRAALACDPDFREAAVNLGRLRRRTGVRR